MAAHLHVWSCGRYASRTLQCRTPDGAIYVFNYFLDRKRTTKETFAEKHGTRLYIGARFAITFNAPLALVCVDDRGHFPVSVTPYGHRSFTQIHDKYFNNLMTAAAAATNENVHFCHVTGKKAFARLHARRLRGHSFPDPGRDVFTTRLLVLRLLLSRRSNVHRRVFIATPLFPIASGVAVLREVTVPPVLSGRRSEDALRFLSSQITVKIKIYVFLPKRVRRIVTKLCWSLKKKVVSIVYNMSISQRFLANTIYFCFVRYFSSFFFFNYTLIQL